MRVSTVDSSIRSQLARWESCEHEHICSDPKDGELCLGNATSWETQMEACSDADVQIVRHTWVYGAKD